MTDACDTARGFGAAIACGVVLFVSELLPFVPSLRANGVVQLIAQFALSLRVGGRNATAPTAITPPPAPPPPTAVAAASIATNINNIQVHAEFPETPNRAPPVHPLSL